MIDWVSVLILLLGGLNSPTRGGVSIFTGRPATWYGTSKGPITVLAVVQ